MLATIAPTLAAIKTIRRPGRPRESSSRLATAGTMLSLYQPPSAFEQIRGVVRHFAAFFKQIAALVDCIAAHIGEGFFTVLRLLADITPRIAAGLRSVEQCDRSA